jgi:hypothetical protein
MQQKFTMRAAALAGATLTFSSVGSAQAEYTGPEPTGVTGKGLAHLFEAPVRLKAADGYVRTEKPGYASPTWHDVDGDGKRDLVVGQFAGGKIRYYKNTGAGTFAAGEWLMAGGKVAEVPGVW